MNAETWVRALLADDSDHILQCWADWLEDQGDAACEGVRWIVRHGKRPQRDALDNSVWWWDRRNTVKTRFYQRSAAIPTRLFKLLRSSYDKTLGCGQMYYCGVCGGFAGHRPDAIYALATAYVAAKYAAPAARSS
jgi:hypothetical protein